MGVAFNRMIEDLQKTTVSRDYFDKIIKSIVDTLIVTDAEGNIKTVNWATLDLLGYEEQEIIGKPVDILFAEESPLKGTRIDDLIKSNVEKTYLTKDGRKISVSSSCSIMRGNGDEITGFVCVARDITEHKQAEEVLRESNKRLEETLTEL